MGKKRDFFQTKYKEMLPNYYYIVFTADLANLNAREAPFTCVLYTNVCYSPCVIRWVLLVQDIHGMCAEIQVPQTFQDSLDWSVSIC